MHTNSSSQCAFLSYIGSLPWTIVETQFVQFNIAGYIQLQEFA